MVTPARFAPIACLALAQLVAGCSTVLGAGLEQTLAASAAATARRARGGCFVPCQHGTACDRRSGYCEPLLAASSDPDAARHPSVVHARAPAPARTDLRAFSCVLPAGAREIVRARAIERAEEVCAAYLEVGQGRCECQEIAGGPRR